MGRWDNQKDKKWNKAGKRFNEICDKYTPKLLKKGMIWWSRKMRKYIILLTFKQFIFALISLLVTVVLVKELGVPSEYIFWLPITPLFLAFIVDYDDGDGDNDEPKDDEDGVIIRPTQSRQFSQKVGTE